jgi:hypothetical protein
MGGLFFLQLLRHNFRNGRMCPGRATQGLNNKV